MGAVRAKKHLGQHFLKDEAIARNIVESLRNFHLYNQVLEIGPGMGVLTKYLFEKKEFETSLIDLDHESIAWLRDHFPLFKERIIEGDFLEMDLENLFPGPFAVIGNFPYNISSQILFKVLEHKNKIPELVGMFQKEVAERIASPPKKKAYGILSVFLQAYFDIEYLFTVDEHVFNPPPRVKSAVIRLTRNKVQKLDCNEKLFFNVVKTGFNQRRKTLRNPLKAICNNPQILADPIFNKRAEELSVEDFVNLTNMIENS
jgi:16S rRNA (adenine1518-N6/adenine1519-N6)-dimethyltransferase